MPEELKNYLSLERLSLRHRFYAYLDSGDYLAGGLFIKHQVRVKFLQAYGKDGSSYRMIFCRILKRDEVAFLEALRELPNKMLLCGHPNYLAQCQQFVKKIEATKEDGRSTCT